MCLVTAFFLEVAGAFGPLMGRDSRAGKNEAVMQGEISDQTEATIDHRWSPDGWLDTSGHVLNVGGERREKWDGNVLV